MALNPLSYDHFFYSTQRKDADVVYDRLSARVHQEQIFPLLKQALSAERNDVGGGWGWEGEKAIF